MVIDPDGDTVTIVISSILQDELVGSQADGSGSGVGEDTALVRAERRRLSSGGNGRVYHIGFTADDGLCGRCRGEVMVGVPLTKRGEAVDRSMIQRKVSPFPAHLFAHHFNHSNAPSQSIRTPRFPPADSRLRGVDWGRICGEHIFDTKGVEIDHVA